PEALGRLETTGYHAPGAPLCAALIGSRRHVRASSLAPMTQSPFAEVPLAPADPILGLTEAFQADKNPKKVNLGVGVYQDGSGKVPVLSVVRDAEKLWYEKEDSKSYLPIDGVPAYRKEVQELLLGKDSPLIAAGRSVTAQALGGTGALK